MKKRGLIWIGRRSRTVAGQDPETFFEPSLNLFFSGRIYEYHKSFSNTSLQAELHLYENKSCTRLQKKLYDTANKG